MEEQKDLYEKAISQVNSLRMSNRYNEATAMMRLASCEELELTENKPGVREQGIDSYYNVGDILISCGEIFGNRRRKDESYESWSKRAKEELQDLYKCKLTGKPCIARMSGFHLSDFCEGNNHEMMVKVNLQTDCPAFKIRENLQEMLKKGI